MGVIDESERKLIECVRAPFIPDKDMGDAVGAGKKCSSEVLMEDPVDSVAETY